MASHKMKINTKFLLSIYTFPTAPTP